MQRVRHRISSRRSVHQVQMIRVARVHGARNTSTLPFQVFLFRLFHELGRQSGAAALERLRGQRDQSVGARAVRLERMLQIRFHLLQLQRDEALHVRHAPRRVHDRSRNRRLDLRKRQPPRARSAADQSADEDYAGDVARVGGQPWPETFELLDDELEHARRRLAARGKALCDAQSECDWRPNSETQVPSEPRPVQRPRHKRRRAGHQQRVAAREARRHVRLSGG
mmetsp:Transcript_15044/g.50480  ORF Transcript_15044/g.50480 Transcript_15044/m.50480 type:complete len:225 (+) Transcript_15044:1399-2073(+)